MKTGKYTKDGREMQVGDVVHFRCKNHPLSGKGVVFMGKQMVLNRKMYKEIKKMDHQDMSNYLSRYYMNAYNQGKEDSEGLKADELREILLTVKGIGPAKAENIMEAVGKALAEKG